MGALIAAIYAGLTYLMSFFGLSFGPLQFRISEALVILPIFTTAAIPGLAVGCFFANIISFSPVDMIFGTLATLISAVLTYLWRNVKFHDLPLLSLVPPVVINGLVVGAEIAFFSIKDGACAPFFILFAVSAAQVAFCELMVCLVVGLPLYRLIKKTKIFSE